MRAASKEEMTLYILMGEALCAIQHLEECLSTSITLKTDVGHPHKTSKTEADLALKRHRRRTLGDAIKHAAKKKLYTDTLQNELAAFLEYRNWLVHRSIDNIYSSKNWEDLFQRLKITTRKAHQFQRAIEDDLVLFSESIGLDMSRVREAIKQEHHGSDLI